MLTLATRYERLPQAVPVVQATMPMMEVAPPVSAPLRAVETEGIKPLALVEQEAINRAIELCGGDVPRAAVALGISASTIYRKKQSWASDKL